MKEQTAVSEIMRSLRHHKLWAYKIPDRPITKAIAQLTRFTPSAPSDIVACSEGAFVAIEVKQFKKWEAFGLRHMRPEQITGLDGIVAHGGRAFVFVNIRIKSPYENRLLIYDWSSLGPRLKRESIKAVELRERMWHYSYLIQNDKRVFDLTEWLMFL